MKQIPNLFTLLNLVSGCIAIVFILQTGEMLVTQNDEGSWIAQLPERIWWGAICIGIAAVIDFLDGFVARLFKAESEMGKQLDSLADIVSFGVAPGLILYQLLRLSFMQEESGLNASLWALAPAVLIPCAGAWRLARFNIDTGQSVVFKGVPIPAAGLVIASLPLIIFYNYFDLAPLLINKWVLYLIIILISWLMVSKLPLLSLKFKDASLKNNRAQYLLIGLGIAAILFLQWLAVPVIFIAYILLSLLMKKSQ